MYNSKSLTKYRVWMMYAVTSHHTYHVPLANQKKKMDLLNVEISNQHNNAH